MTAKCTHDWCVVDKGIISYNHETGGTTSWVKIKCTKCYETDIGMVSA